MPVQFRLEQGADGKLLPVTSVQAGALSFQFRGRPGPLLIEAAARLENAEAPEALARRLESLGPLDPRD